jgi:hypothetical protein
MGVPKTNYLDAHCCDTAHLESAANVKAAPGVVYWIEACETAGTAAAFVLHDATSGTTGEVATFKVPANSTVFCKFIPAIYCATGIRLGTVGTALQITVGYA